MIQRINISLILSAISFIAIGSESMSLINKNIITEQNEVAVKSVISLVKEAGFDPSTFRTRINCDESYCNIDVFPEELETKEYEGYMGCPLKYCATIKFSLKTNSIVEKVHWR